MWREMRIGSTAGAPAPNAKSYFDRSIVVAIWRFPAVLMRRSRPAFGECCLDPWVAEEVRIFCADSAVDDLQGLLRRAFGPYHNRADHGDRKENGHHNADRSSHSIAPMSEPWGDRC